MAEPLEVLIGSAHGDHVRISVLRRERSDVHDYGDGNWLLTPISLRVGSFTGELAADLRTDELARFRTELESVCRHLTGEAVLSSLDGWVTVRVGCEANGSLRITGEADDQPAVGNQLRFRIDGLDQSYLPAIIAALAEVEERHPVRSSPQG